MKATAVFGLLSCFFITAISAQENSGKISIQNDSLAVEWQANGTFSVTAKKTGRAFLQAGRLEGQVLDAKVRSINDPTFGPPAPAINQAIA